METEQLLSLESPADYCNDLLSTTPTFSLAHREIVGFGDLECEMYMHQEPHAICLEGALRYVAK
jgi:hypothetical protein